MLEDKDIIARCQIGKLEDFALLYDKYAKKIYSFIYFKTQHKETAEDLVTQVFIKALENINKFEISKGTFQAWIYKIARNKVIDHYRTAKHDTDIEDIWDLEDDSDVQRDIDTKQKLIKVDEYLKKLKSDQREIISMRVWQEMSYQEIAAALGKSEASCKMAFSRAINKLREEMPLAILISLLMMRF
jgi:RNA polymerase sigma-70 factor (ECF subfamily)